MNFPQTMAEKCQISPENIRQTAQFLHFSYQVHFKTAYIYVRVNEERAFFSLKLWPPAHKQWTWEHIQETCR